jgi:hypothetical protein
VTGLADLLRYHVEVDLLGKLRVSLDSNDTGLFEMVQPMASPAGGNGGVDLIGLDPSNLVDVLIAGERQ